MEQEFYRSRLVERHGLEVLIPEADDRDTVHRIIYDELCLGRIDADSRAAYIGIINRQVEKGAQAIILGCTRSEEHTSELQSLMRTSYAVFCLKKKNKKNITHNIR